MPILQHTHFATYLRKLHHAGAGDDANAEGLAHGRLQARGVREVAVDNQLVEAFVRNDAQLQCRL